MLEFAGEGVNLQKSAVFCENLRFGLSLSLSVTLVRAQRNLFQESPKRCPKDLPVLSFVRSPIP